MRGVHRWLIAGVLGVLAVAPPARAHDADGHFPLPSFPRSASYPTDLAVLPDGGLVAAGEADTVYLAPGAPQWRRIPDLLASGVAAASDGSVLAIAGNRVYRWRPGGEPIPVAGTDEFGDHLGDGGPALAADLAMSESDPMTVGIAALPDGGFLFTDTGNHRVRQVDPSGTIRTVAGTGRPARASDASRGDGGPATAAPLTAPLALAVTDDGGFVVLEENRVRRVRPDGVIETAMRLRTSPDVGGDLVALADGRVLVLTEGATRWVPGTGQGIPAIFAFDFAWRYTAAACAVAGEGRSLFAGCERLWWVQGVGPARRAVALRDARVSRTRTLVVAEVSVPSRVTLRLLRRGRVLRSVSADTRAGHVTFSLGRLAHGWHRLQVSIDGGWGDAVNVWGGRLTFADARRILSANVAGGEETVAIFRGRRCRVIGPRRVDCEVKLFEDVGRGREHCLYMASLQLAATGILKRRGYRCGNGKRGRFDARPEWRPQLARTVSAPRSAVTRP